MCVCVACVSTCVFDSVGVTAYMSVCAYVVCEHVLGESSGQPRLLSQAVRFTTSELGVPPCHLSGTLGWDPGPQGSQLQRAQSLSGRCRLDRGAEGFGPSPGPDGVEPKSTHRTGWSGWVSRPVLVGQLDDIAHLVAVCEPPALSGQCG